MSTKRVIPSEMKRLTDIHEAGIERLLSGHALSDDADLGEVARFFDEVRDAYPEAAADGCEEAHLARMFEAAHILAESGDPVARPVSNANGPVTQVAGLPKLGRIEMIKTLMGSTKFKVIAASLALLVASSGTAFAASQGALPVPIQDAVSGAAAAVGIDVPTADESFEADNEGAVEVDAIESLDESATVAGDQGDEQDDAVPAVQTADEEDDSEADDQDADQADDQDADESDDQDADQADDQDADQADDQTADQDADQADDQDADQADDQDADQADQADESDAPTSDDPND